MMRLREQYLELVSVFKGTGRNFPFFLFKKASLKIKKIKKPCAHVKKLLI